MLRRGNSGFDPSRKWSVHRSSRDDVDLRMLVPTATIVEPNSYASSANAADKSYAAAKIKMADIRKYAVCPLLFGQIGLRVPARSIKRWDHSPKGCHQDSVIIIIILFTVRASILKRRAAARSLRPSIHQIAYTPIHNHTKA